MKSLLSSGRSSQSKILKIKFYSVRHNLRYVAFWLQGLVCSDFANVTRKETASEIALLVWRCSAQFHNLFVGCLRLCHDCVPVCRDLFKGEMLVVGSTGGWPSRSGRRERDHMLIRTLHKNQKKGSRHKVGSQSVCFSQHDHGADQISPQVSHHYQR